MSKDEGWRKQRKKVSKEGGCRILHFDNDSIWLTTEVADSNKTSLIVSKTSMKDK